MGDYSDISNQNNINHVKIIEREVVKKEPNSGEKLNIDEIADKIAEKLMGNIGIINENISKNVSKNVKLDKEDDFDVSSTMENLAKAMVVNRKEDSNFKDLGETKVNKAKDSTQNTIDLLSDLDD